MKNNIDPIRHIGCWINDGLSFTWRKRWAFGLLLQGSIRSLCLN